MSQGHSPSFNQDFCEELEYVLCYVFDHSKDAELRRFWCDGISWSPYYNEEVNRAYLSNDKVQERGMIETTAYSGVSGQDRYALKVNLGKLARELYQKGESLIVSIPSANKDWVEIDPEQLEMELRL